MCGLNYVGSYICLDDDLNLLGKNINTKKFKQLFPSKNLSNCKYK
jgi:hypothetical protein